MARRAVTVVTLFAMILLATSHGEAEHHGSPVDPSSAVEVLLGVEQSPAPLGKTGLISLDCSVSCAAPLPCAGLARRVPVSISTVRIPSLQTACGADLTLSTPPPRIG